VAIESQLAAFDPTPAPDSSPGIRRRQKELRPNQILEAAFLEFAAKGYGATRLADVAARIGITKGTIYVYFPSKADLFKATVRAHLGPVFAKIAAVADEPQGPVRDLFRAMLDVGYREFVDNPRSQEFYRLLIGDASRDPEVRSFCAQELFELGTRSLLFLLDYGVARGELKPGLAERLKRYPEILIAPAAMAAIDKLMLGEGVLPDSIELMDMHLALIMDGLAAR